MRSQPWYFILTLSLILVFVPTQVVLAAGAVAADQNHTALLLTNLMTFLLPLGLILLAVGAASEERAVDVAVAGLLSWGLAVLGYFVCGFALQFGGVGLLSEMEGLSLLTAEWSPLDLSWGTGWGLMGLRGFALNADASTLGAYLLFFSQLPLVVTAVLIPVLSLVGRVRRSALFAIALLISAVVYPIVGNWIWGGGWLSNLGRTVALGHGTVDFLGSGTVHLLGGMTALIGIVVFRLRKPEISLSEVASMPPVHFPLFMILGALLAALGWMASVAGNPLVPADIPIVVVMVNLLFAAVGGTLTALFYAWFTTTRPDALMGARGAIAGLVAASASC
ncbi:MAG: ammonium transporter, partial [Anaerolineae bacterium]|nr:ammonium transporter [Anaerolineae bacterium]